MQDRKNVNLRLIEAARNGWTEEIRAALEAGADVNYVDVFYNRNTALTLALMYGYPDAAYLLLEQGNIHINYAAESGTTALIWASTKGYTEILRFILEKPDVNVNAVDASGMSALMHALDHGYRDAASLLLAREEIDLNLESLLGNKALHVACL